MASNTNIYQDIATRTNGDIYIGVVGPVRSGKSTFIRNFMERLVIPNISDDHEKLRAVDELPQASAGRTIMTTEPKFIPENAVEIQIGDLAKMNVRMIDCVGFVVKSAIGYTENDMPRFVSTPWAEQLVDFEKAAEMGTQKVICDHSTVGVVITTDGSIGDIPREDYVSAEERTIAELKKMQKPFVVIVNTMFEKSDSVRSLCEDLQQKYGVAVLPVNCAEIESNAIEEILEALLREFPIQEILVDVPSWVNTLPFDHSLPQMLYSALQNSGKDMERVCQLQSFVEQIEKLEIAQKVEIDLIDMGRGSITVRVTLLPHLYFEVLSDTAGETLQNDADLFDLLLRLTDIRDKYQKIGAAFEMAQQKGYGIIEPKKQDLQLEKPVLFKQGGRYGVKICANAPCYHIIKADVNADVAPIVGDEEQSEQLVSVMEKEYDEDPLRIWDSNIFGKSVYDMVNEGLQLKINRIPDDSRFKLQETLSKIVNEGSGGLICIIL